MSISFNVDTDEVLRFDPNGNIYVRGELVDSNKEVYDAMISFLEDSGYLVVTEWDDAEVKSIEDLG